eukprot:364643-Chlamydomonas_euryale.AAC.9
MYSHLRPTHQVTGVALPSWFTFSTVSPPPMAAASLFMKRLYFSLKRGLKMSDLERMLQGRKRQNAMTWATA